MSLPLYTVDAFTSVPFAGNPAAVCLDATKQGLSEGLMQQIATEMNLSETAYIRRLSQTDSFQHSCRFGLRWFTPTKEVPLCGHATLASAAVLFTCLGNGNAEVIFETLSGDLKAKRRGSAITLDLPLNTPQPQDLEELEDLISVVTSADNIEDIQYSHSTKKLLLRLKDCTTRSQLEDLTPDLVQMTSVHSGKVAGIIVTVKGSEDTGCVDRHGQVYDFISRYFAPWVGIPEDPVTGSAHTVLAGYWSKILGKKQLYARQCSRRGGELQMILTDDKTLNVTGEAAVIVSGSIPLTQ